MDALKKRRITNNEVIEFNEFSDVFYCLICPTKFIIGTWESHVKNPIHIITLEQFNSIFEHHGKNVYCKYCNVDFKWEMLSTHGNAHMIASGGKLNDVYEIFFENRIIACKNQFYCCSCKIDFPDSHGALCHVGDLLHSNLNKKNSLITEQTLSTLSGIKHELFVFEGLVLADPQCPTDSTALECHVCDNVIVEFDKVLMHIKSFYHQFYKLKFSSKVPEKMNDLIEPEVPNEPPLRGFLSRQFSYDSNTFDKELTGKTSLCNYIKKFDDTRSYCVICQYTFVSHEMKNHVAETDHRDAIKRFDCTDISSTGEICYYCKCCSCTIFGIDNLNFHIMGKRHSKSLPKSREFEIPKQPETEKHQEKLEMMKQPETKEPEKRSDKLEMKKPETKEPEKRSDKSEIIKKPEMEKPPDEIDILKKLETGKPDTKIPETIDANVLPFVSMKYITRKNATECLCKVCDTELSNLKEIEDHLTGIEHERLLKKYGSENIVCTGENLYYCKSCDCRISGFDNVCFHLRGRRHAFCITATTKRDVEITAKQTELSTVLSSVITTEFSKFLKKLRLKNRRTSNKSCNLRNIITAKSIAETQPIFCNFCPVVVTNSAELHSHLANHLSQEFANSIIDQNANTEPNDYTSKIRNSENSESLKKVSKNDESIENTKIIKNQDKDGNFLSGVLNDNNMNCNSSKFSKLPMKLNIETSDSETDFSVENVDSEKRRSSLKKTTMKKIVPHLDFNKDYIYDISEKLRSIELGMKLCFINDSKNIYCLVCRKTVANTLQNYFEHLCSLNHTSNLEGIEKDHARFAIAEEQFSELRLAYQYMEEISNEQVRCLICEMDVENIDYVLQDHIDDESHEMIREKMHINATQNFENVKGRMQCDWYKVQKYWCVPCSAYFGSEVNFLKHLKSVNHQIVMGKSENIDRKLIYDFCPPCALLWYGYRYTYAYHCDVPSHKWLVRDGHYSSPNLPEIAKKLLANPEKYVNDTIEYLEGISTREREKERTLLNDLENVVRKKFFKSKAYMFGSRILGFGSTDSHIDVFLDCGDLYDGNATLENDLMHLMTDVDECLSNEIQSWDRKEIIMNCRTPIVRFHHKATGLTCDISFENGLSVENTKFIKSIIDIFPPCRKLILFLKHWMECCNLSGTDQITSYTIYWYVIFYLQKESILPSIARLIAMKKKFRTIGGWEFDASHDFMYNKAESNYSFKEFLIRFFTFYGNFDFRNDVACPLLGDVLKKKAFADIENLPNEMAPYIAYMKHSDNSEPFQVDSDMCIQDPFNLSQNLTKALSKVLLCRFRTYCLQSLDILYSS